ncbi:zinc finger matrin-type protein 5 [Chrysoperla carnea]|uniref:zinc finger matrin-type protein 5 n=1 Tax=Chrysoperla carnea TaxID=189513 RepID=UPI001D07C3BD|nr:zinc finger matrin-type protein 5 [Chrysoperla carnea]
MGRRYYCDFCEKSFIDDLEARKKHLSGLAHQQVKYQHYHPFRDPKEIFEEESRKTECRKFLKGTCLFGLKCNYSHYTVAELAEIKQLVEENERIEQQKQMKIEYENTNIPSLEEWLKRYHERISQNSNKDPKIYQNSDDDYVWTYPSFLEHRTDLPPSLHKLQPYHFSNDKFASWG